MIYLFIILYTINNALYEWAYKEDITVNEYQIFHTFSFLRNIFTIVGIWYFSLFPIDNSLLWIVAASGTIYWIIFDMVRNLLFCENIFHVGHGGMDMFFRNWQYLIKAILLILILFLK